MLRNAETAPYVDPTRFAENTRALLDEDRRRYRLFGAYWYFVKALLKRFYDQHDMPILGAHVDPDVVDRMPSAPDLQSAIRGALDTYQHNAVFNLGRNKVEDDEGETFWLLDPDVEG